MDRSPTFAERRVGKQMLCPFGCAEGQVDQHGYCDHLVGFTNDGKTLEPLKPGVWIGKDEKAHPSGYSVLDGAHPEPVRPGDVVKWITTSARVYRKAPDKKAS